MERTRHAILDGAAEAIQMSGPRTTTMAEIATAAGVAKATLYNHFRTRAEVYASLAAREVETLAALLRDAPPAERGLRGAADWLAAHPLVRAVVADEPDQLAWLVAQERAPALWAVVRDAIGALLCVDAADPAADLALRWLASFVTTPGSVVMREREAALVVAGCAAAGSVAGHDER